MIMYSCFKVKSGGLKSYYLIWVKHTQQDVAHYAIIKILYLNNTDYCYVVLNSSERNRKYYYSNDLYHSVIDVISPGASYASKVLGNLYQGAYFFAYVKHGERKDRSGQYIIGRVIDLEEMIYEVVSYSFKNLFYIYKDSEFKLLDVFAKSVTM